MEDNQLEHIVVLAEELITVMNNEKIEKNILESIKKEWQQILEFRELQKVQSKNIIQGMLEIKSEEEAKFKKSESAVEQIKQETQQLEQFVSQQKEELSTVVSMCDRLQQNLDACQQEVKRVELEKQEVDKQKKISIPKTRHDISLYKLISNLHWELDTPPNQLKGYVCGNTEVKPFSLDKSQMSKYDIANTLWDMIEEDW